MQTYEKFAHPEGLIIFQDLGGRILQGGGKIQGG